MNPSNPSQSKAPNESARLVDDITAKNVGAFALGTCITYEAISLVADPMLHDAIPNWAKVPLAMVSAAYMQLRVLRRQ